MERLSRRIGDKVLLGLIRGYLQAGILAGGLVMERHEGTPQGGPLSPLLANILLDEIDQELERRGHSFVRYADDCNVYVRSQRAGERVMSLLRRLRAFAPGSERAEECGGPCAWPEVSGLQFLVRPRWRGPARSGRKDAYGIQVKGAGADTSGTWSEIRSDRGGSFGFA